MTLGHELIVPAIGLVAVEFDECSGAIKRLHALRDGMLASVCHVDEPGP